MNSGLLGLPPGPFAVNSGNTGVQFPVGTWSWFTSYAPYITMPDGSVWLQNGVKTPVANASPLITKIGSILSRNQNAATITFTGSTNPTLFSLATNGSGTWVFAGPMASVGVVFISTNDGQTWTSQTVAGATLTFSDVAYDAVNGQFIIVGNSATLLQVYSSPNGTTWTAGTSVPSITGATTNSARVGTYNGTSLILVSGTSTAASTTNGTTWTTRSSGGIAVGKPCYIAGLWLALSTAGNQYYSTSPDMSTWTSRTSSLWGGTFFYQKDNRFIAANAAGTLVSIGGVFFSTDGINWTQKVSMTNLSPVVLTDGTKLMGMFAGLTTLASSYRYIYTIDGSNFYEGNISPSPLVTSVLGAANWYGCAGLSSSGALVTIGTYNANVAMYCNVNTQFDNVEPIAISPPTGQTNLNAFVRIK